MASNRHLGFEEVIVNKDLYLFKANFNFLQELKESNESDAMKMYESFSSGECDLDLVVSVLSCGLYSINGDEISNKQVEVERLISEFGLQQCWYLVFKLLSDAMIGDVKKSHLQMDEKIQKMLEFNNFLSTSLKKQPLLWVYQVWIFGICLWVSFNLISPLIT